MLEISEVKERVENGQLSVADCRTILADSEGKRGLSGAMAHPLQHMRDELVAPGAHVADEPLQNPQAAMNEVIRAIPYAAGRVQPDTHSMFADLDQAAGALHKILQTCPGKDLVAGVNKIRTAAFRLRIDVRHWIGSRDLGEMLRNTRAVWRHNSTEARVIDEVFLMCEAGEEARFHVQTFYPIESGRAALRRDHPGASAALTGKDHSGAMKTWLYVSDQRWKVA